MIILLFIIFSSVSVWSLSESDIHRVKTYQNKELFFPICEKKCKDQFPFSPQNVVVCKHSCVHNIFEQIIQKLTAQMESKNQSFVSLCEKNAKSFLQEKKNLRYRQYAQKCRRKGVYYYEPAFDSCIVLQYKAECVKKHQKKLVKEFVNHFPIAFQTAVSKKQGKKSKKIPVK